MEFRLLGPLEVAVEQRLIEIGRPQVRALLTILLMRPGRLITNDDLIDRLWDGRPPASPEATLQSHVRTLRRLLEPGVTAGDHQLVVTRPGGYVLCAMADQIDVHRFQASAAEATAALHDGRFGDALSCAEHGLALWRGQALADVRDRHFARSEIVRLDEQRRSLYEFRAEARLALGQHARAVPELEARVVVEPLHERLWELLLLALYRCGRQADALEAYQRLRRQIGEELGLDPGPELRRLEQAILTQSPALDWVPPVSTNGSRRPRGLPALLARLVGREDEAAAVTRLLEGSRLVTLTGVGGVGKTRLAIAVAERLAATVETVFVPLAAVGDPALVLTVIASAMGRGEDNSVSDIAADLQDRPFVLALDNLEQLPAASPVITALLGACPGLRVLATSRLPLRIAGERRYRVPPLPVPGAGDDAEQVMGAPAVALYWDRVEAADAGIVLEGAALAAAAEICRRLDGLPLAIELAAARATVLPPVEMLARLERRLDVPAGGDERPSRQRTLRATIAWSHDLLAPSTQVVFARLGALVDGATLDEVAAVCGEADVGVHEAVTTLVDSGLARLDHAHADARLRMLETIREYAVERLDERGEHAAVCDRLIAHLLGRAEIGRPAPGYADDRRLEWLDAEPANLRVALDWGLARGDVRAARLLAAVERWWFQRGTFTEGRMWVEAALARLTALPASLRAALLLSGASLAANQGAVDHASARYEEARLLWRELGNLAGQARCANGTAALLLAGRRPEEAMRLLDHGLALARSAGDETLVVRLLGNLGAAAEAAGDHQRAGVHYADGLDLARRAGQPVAVVRASVGLALVRLRAGAQDESRRLATAALELASTLRSPTEHVAALVVSGIVTLESDGLEAAATAWQRFSEALAICRESGQTPWVSDCLSALGCAARVAGELHQAVRLFGAAARVLDDVQGMAEAGIDRDCYDHHLAALRAELAPDEFRRAWSEGWEAPIDDLIAADPTPADPAALMVGVRDRKRWTDSRLPAEKILAHRDADRR